MPEVLRINTRHARIRVYCGVYTGNLFIRGVVARLFMKGEFDEIW